MTFLLDPGLAAIAARETMAETWLDLSSEAEALRGVSALSDREAEMLGAALAARRRLSEVEVAHLQEANQLHTSIQLLRAHQWCVITLKKTHR